MDTLAPTAEPSQAVVSLATNHGAHIVLCDESKAPYWDGRKYSWPKRRPSAAVIEAHDGMFGIVPWSIQTTGLDVDRGNPLQLALTIDPLATLPSRRGHHLYCADTEGRPNSHWEAGGCSGDVRGNQGYLMFHFDGAARLLDAIRRRDDWHPRDLFELAGITTPGVCSAPPTSPLTVAPTALEQATKGCRYESLRAYMGPVVRITERPRRWPGGPVNAREFVKRVEELTAAALDSMPAPRIPWSEARWLAYQLASWFASHAGKADGSASSQAWRGRRGKGRTFNGPARASLFADLSNEAAQPWLADGVSRRTWYRRRARART